MADYSYDTVLGQLFDFYTGVGKGFGQEWRGVLFRYHFADLDVPVEICKQLGAEICNNTDRNGPKYLARWPSGELMSIQVQPATRNTAALRSFETTCVWLGWDLGYVLASKNLHDTDMYASCCDAFAVIRQFLLAPSLAIKTRVVFCTSEEGYGMHTIEVYPPHKPKEV